MTVRKHYLNRFENVMKFWGLGIVIIALVFLLIVMGQIPRCDHEGTWIRETDHWILSWNDSRPEIIIVEAKTDATLLELRWPPKILTLNKTSYAGEIFSVIVHPPSEEHCLTRTIQLQTRVNGQIITEKIALENRRTQ